MSQNTKLLNKVKEIEKLVQRNGNNNIIKKTMVGLAILTALGKGEVKAQESENTTRDDKKIDNKEYVMADLQATTNQGLSYRMTHKDTINIENSGLEVNFSYGNNHFRDNAYVKTTGDSKLGAKAGLFNSNESFVDEVSASRMGVGNNHGISGYGAEVSLKLKEQAMLKGGAIFAKGTDGKLIGFSAQDTLRGAPIWYLTAMKKDFYASFGAQSEGGTGFFCVGGKILENKDSKIMIEGSHMLTGNSQLALYARHNFKDKFLLEGIAKLSNKENSFEIVASKALGKSFALYGKAKVSNKEIINSNVNVHAGIRMKINSGRR